MLDLAKSLSLATPMGQGVSLLASKTTGVKGVSLFNPSPAITEALWIARPPVTLRTSGPHLYQHLWLSRMHISEPFLSLSNLDQRAPRQPQAWLLLPTRHILLCCRTQQMVASYVGNPVAVRASSVWPIVHDIYGTDTIELRISAQSQAVLRAMAMDLVDPTKSQSICGEFTQTWDSRRVARLSCWKHLMASGALKWWTMQCLHCT
jgi:hypothetical protein